MADLKTYKGTLKREFFNVGSKSEHKGVALETAEGDIFQVKVREGNPFSDPLLDSYVGKYVELEAETLPNYPTILFVPKYRDIAVMKPPAA